MLCQSSCGFINLPARIRNIFFSFLFIFSPMASDYVLSAFILCRFLFADYMQFVLSPLESKSYLIFKNNSGKLRCKSLNLVAQNLLFDNICFWHFRWFPISARPAKLFFGSANARLRLQKANLALVVVFGCLSGIEFLI